MVFQCKMCGAALNYIQGNHILKCEYCKTMQTVPRLDGDKRAHMYERANHYRRNNEYDKAMGIFESILNEDNTDAEAYWSLVLCRYGVDYVKDPYTSKYIPTINRTQYKSIFSDEDYKSAISYADEAQIEIYKSEAAAIDKLQSDILTVAKNEAPFDIFICYKETDKNGNRTVDSIYAQDIYNALTKEGYKVFFSRITLEDKLGQAYEPYIFSALNTAKVMVVAGTSHENFNAPWVKNEWSRYLALIKNGEDKFIIPAFKGMNPYDLPQEFSNLQAQDMAKIGFLQDLVRGIGKLLKPAGNNKENTSIVYPINTEALCKRIEIFLADGNFSKADEYTEKALDLEPENAKLYIYKLLISLEIKNTENLISYPKAFYKNTYYIKAVNFAKGDYLQTVKNYAAENTYLRAKALVSNSTFYKNYETAADLMESIKPYKDSEIFSFEYRETARNLKNEEDYNRADKILSSAINVEGYKTALNLFEQLNGYKDSVQKANSIKRKIARKKKMRKIAIIAILSAVVMFFPLLFAARAIASAIDYNARNGLTLKYDSAQKYYSIVDSGKNENTEIVIPSSYKGKPVKEIGEHAFANRTSLTSITIPDSVISIGGGAFSGCANLTSITIPNSVTSIGSFTFEHCTSLTSITIPDSVTIISYGTFSGCTNLTSITIPDSVIRIGYEAFFGCTSLTSITIPDSVTIISYGAFSGCANLTSITIPDGITNISAWAFSDCTNLTSITIPDSVTSIDSDVFVNCTSLTSITFNGTKAQWHEIVKLDDWDNNLPLDYTIYCTDGIILIYG